MSWQAWVDSSLVGSGQIARAAIIGPQGGVWAQSAGYTITPVEQQAIINGFNDRSQFQARGIMLGGHKFIYTGDHADASRITGKKGADGVIILKSTRGIIAIVIAEYVGPIQAPEAMTVVVPVIAALER